MNFELKSVPDFKKITQMIKENPKERYVIVEKGKPSWVVLNMADYESLIKTSEEKQRTKDKKKESEIDEALAAYQEEIREGIEFPAIEKESRERKSEPELYFEEISEGVDQDRPLGLSTEDQEFSETEEFDSIPF